jgi:hypothetical protein
VKYRSVQGYRLSEAIYCPRLRDFFLRNLILSTVNTKIVAGKLILHTNAFKRKPGRKESKIRKNRITNSKDSVETICRLQSAHSRF